MIGVDPLLNDTSGVNPHFIDLTTTQKPFSAEVRNDKNPVSWAVAGFEDGDLKKRLLLIAKGKGGVEELKDTLRDDQIMYAFYRNMDIIDDIPTVKFVYIYWYSIYFSSPASYV